MMSHTNYAVMIAGLVGAGMEEYTKRFLKRLKKHAQHHKGCLAYNVHQSINDPREFMMYSIWVNQQAFEEHNQTPEMQEFKKHLVKAMFDIESPKTHWKVLPEADKE